MITVYADNRQIRLNVPTLGMSPQDVILFLQWLELDASARHGELAGRVATDLSEQVKTVWWAENCESLIAAHGRPVKQV